MRETQPIQESVQIKTCVSFLMFEVCVTHLDREITAKTLFKTAASRNIIDAT